MFQKQKIETRVIDDFTFIIKRSIRRKKTVQFSFKKAEKEITLLCPAFLGDKELENFIKKGKKHFLKDIKRSSENKDKKSELNVLAENLAKKYLFDMYDKIQDRVESLHISFSNKKAYKLFGKYCKETNSIVLAQALNKVPKYVLEFILYHEIVHIVSFSHDKNFRILEKRFTKMDKAEGFLDAMSLFGKEHNF